MNISSNTFNLEDLSPQLQILVQLELKQKKLEEAFVPIQLQMKVEETPTTSTTAAIPETFVSPSDWRRDTNSVICAIEKRTKNYSMLRGKIYREVEARGKCNLSIRLENLKKNMLIQGASRTKISTLNYLDVIEKDERLIHVFLSVVRDLALAHHIPFNITYQKKVTL